MEKSIQNYRTTILNTVNPKTICPIIKRLLKGPSDRPRRETDMILNKFDPNKPICRVTYAYIDEDDITHGKLEKDLFKLMPSYYEEAFENLKSYINKNDTVIYDDDLNKNMYLEDRLIMAFEGPEEEDNNDDNDNVFIGVEIYPYGIGTNKNPWDNNKVTVHFNIDGYRIAFNYKRITEPEIVKSRTINRNSIFKNELEIAPGIGKDFKNAKERFHASGMRKKKKATNKRKRTIKKRK
jgi:hypothetical protein